MKIKFPSGKVVFANYFHDGDDYSFNVPKQTEFTKYSLNSYEGINNRCEYLFKKFKLLYIQTGNTTVEILRHKNGDIYIPDWCEDYYGDDYLQHMEENGELEEFYEEWYIGGEEQFKKDKAFYDSIINDVEVIGRISCSVWRVEMLDKNVFDKTENIIGDEFIAEVEGTYELETSSNSDLNHLLFAHLKKVK